MVKSERISVHDNGWFVLWVFAANAITPANVFLQSVRPIVYGFRDSGALGLYGMQETDKCFPSWVIELHLASPGRVNCSSFSSLSALTSPIRHWRTNIIERLREVSIA